MRECGLEADWTRRRRRKKGRRGNSDARTHRLTDRLMEQADEVRGRKRASERANERGGFREAGGRGDGLGRGWTDGRGGARQYELSRAFLRGGVRRITARVRGGGDWALGYGNRERLNRRSRQVSSLEFLSKKMLGLIAI